MNAKLSKQLAFLLRHPPENGGVTLDELGWASVLAILLQDGFSAKRLTYNQLEDIVTSDTKRRFEFDESHRRIRARYGHSARINLNYPEATPPDILYHGTQVDRIDKILVLGLQPMTRAYVHLSDTKTLARKTANRRKGQSVLLEISTKTNPHPFHTVGDGIWLSKAISPQCIKII